MIVLGPGDSFSVMLQAANSSGLLVVANGEQVPVGGGAPIAFTAQAQATTPAGSWITAATAPAGFQVLIHNVIVMNQNGSASCGFIPGIMVVTGGYVTGAANVGGTPYVTVPPSGMAIHTRNGWRIYDSTGTGFPYQRGYLISDGELMGPVTGAYVAATGTMDLGSALGFQFSITSPPQLSLLDTNYQCYLNCLTAAYSTAYAAIVLSPGDRFGPTYSWQPFTMHSQVQAAMGFGIRRSYYLAASTTYRLYALLSLGSASFQLWNAQDYHWLNYRLFAQ